MRANEIVIEDRPGDKKIYSLLLRARAAHPNAKSDEEALILWDIEQNKREVTRLNHIDDRLDVENDREEADISRLDGENNLEQADIARIIQDQEEANRQLDQIKKQLMQLAARP